MRRLILAFLFLLLGIGAALAQSSEGTVLRPGDVLYIGLPGEPSLNKTFTIDRQGEIILPEIGRLHVAGNTVPQASDAVRTALSRVFRDLGRFDLALEERRLPVTVLGYVRTPGPVDLPDGATVQQAIQAAGGLVPGAQLDKVQLRRNGKITTFDYKRYLDTGDTSLIPPLQPLDEVFVPASPLTGNVQVDFDAQTLTSAGDASDEKNAVKLFGEVNNAGAFSYKPGASVVDYLLRAGGVTRFGGVEQIRILTEGEPIIFNLKDYLDNPSKGAPTVSAGATIFVPIATEEIKSGGLTVYVMGEVFKPGAFEMKPGASFLDILANAGGPTRFAETRQVRILRGDGKVDKFDLAAYTEGASIRPPTVRPGDAVFVPEKVDVNEKSWLKVPPSRAISVMGAINSPGRYEWSDEMNLLDLLGHAGGPTQKADTSKVQVVPDPRKGGKTRVFDLAGFLQKGGSLADIPTVGAGYTIVIPEMPQDPSDMRATWTSLASDRSIYVLGAVGAPGRYAFNEKFSFLDILSAANGPTAAADLYNIKVSHNEGPTPRVTGLNLALYFDTGDPSLLPRVKPGDVIYVPERGREWLDEPSKDTVRVLGAVGRPGRYRFDDRMTILDLLAEAGGPTGDALVERIVIVNLSCCADQARSFNLIAFATTGDITKLPVVRGGDTIYVPNKSQSNWQIFMESIRDAVSVLSLVVLVSAL
ncbi:MAG: SLBB domain-containing protein [Geminicoccaceae bacterium]